ncbi:MAG: SsrA-binding protein SmpB [Okeania sp. SIO3B3]|nr:SsrA-binding protein SmpB [Okeania sp. SIO3B3]
MNTTPIKIISINKKAKFEYQVIDSYEAGIVLLGTEVKSIRAGHITLKEGYSRVIDDELWLIGAHISEYKQGNQFNHEVRRNRKLLLHKKELRKIHSEVKEKGITLVPLKVYLKKGRIKIEIGLCKGKQTHDKRETIKKREQEREINRVTKEYR